MISHKLLGAPALSCAHHSDVTMSGGVPTRDRTSPESATAWEAAAQRPRQASGNGSAAIQREQKLRLASEMRNSPYWPLRQLEIHVTENAVYVRGEVPNFFMKQMAQEIVRRHAPKPQIQNQVRVCWNPGRGA